MYDSSVHGYACACESHYAQREWSRLCSFLLFVLARSRVRPRSCASLRGGEHVRSYVYMPVYVYARARPLALCVSDSPVLMVEVSEVVSSLSRTSTTCPRSLTILYDAYIVPRLFIRRPYTTCARLFSLTFAQSLLILSLSLSRSRSVLLSPRSFLLSVSFFRSSRSFSASLSIPISLRYFSSRRPTRSPLSYRI